MSSCKEYINAVLLIVLMYAIYILYNNSISSGFINTNTQAELNQIDSELTKLRIQRKTIDSKLQNLLHKRIVAKQKNDIKLRKQSRSTTGRNLPVNGRVQRWSGYQKVPNPTGQKMNIPVRPNTQYSGGMGGFDLGKFRQMHAARTRGRDFEGDDYDPNDTVNPFKQGFMNGEYRDERTY